MAQFDVHRHAGRGRQTFPLLVVVQSRKLDHLPSRLVLPLRIASVRDLNESSLAVLVLGSLYLLRAELMFTAQKRILGEVVASLEPSSSQIIQAIDDVITTAYG